MYDPMISLLGVRSEDLICYYRETVQSCLLPVFSQQLDNGNNLISLNCWMGNENVAHMHNSIELQRRMKSQNVQVSERD